MATKKREILCQLQNQLCFKLGAISRILLLRLALKFCNRKFEARSREIRRKNCVSRKFDKSCRLYWLLLRNLLPRMGKNEEAGCHRSSRIIQSFIKVSAVRSSTKDDVFCCIRRTSRRKLKKTFGILELRVQQQIASNCAVGRRCFFILIFATCTIEKFL